MLVLLTGCGRKADPPAAITGKVPQLYPTALNARGALVGSIRFPDLYPSLRIENGRQSELALPADASWVYPLGLNDAGQIVGYASRARNQSRHAVLWQQGHPTWLEDGDAADSEAVAINNAGVIAGFRTTADGATRAVQWRRGILEEIGPPGSPSWRPSGINAAGEVVGCGVDAASRPHLYVWRQQRLTDLGTGYHIAVNNLGQIACDSLAADRRLHACVWNGTACRELPALPGTNESRVFALNDAGQIVGSASFRGVQTGADGTPTPLLWEHGRALDLNTVRPPNADYRLEEAVGISSAGQILCTARQGKWGRTALLTPTPNGWRVQLY